MAQTAAVGTQGGGCQITSFPLPIGLWHLPLPPFQDYIYAIFFPSQPLYPEDGGSMNL